MSRRKKKLTDEELGLFSRNEKPDDDTAFEVFVMQKRIEGVQERIVDNKKCKLVAIKML